MILAHIYGVDIAAILVVVLMCLGLWYKNRKLKKYYGVDVGREPSHTQVVQWRKDGRAFIEEVYQKYAMKCGNCKGSQFEPYEIDKPIFECTCCGWLTEVLHERQETMTLHEYVRREHSCPSCAKTMAYCIKTQDDEVRKDLVVTTAYLECLCGYLKSMRSIKTKKHIDYLYGN